MPKKRIEIEPGTRFGTLTVLERVEDFRYPYGGKASAYRCLCDCGNEKVISASNLIHGRSRSCGCQIGRTSTRIRDLTGQTFGKLTAIKRGSNKVDSSGKQRTRWWCKCACGNPDLVLVQTDCLVQGFTGSCGCDRGLARRLTNQYEFRDDFVIGYTQKGRPFFISNEDYDKIKEYCWVESRGYVVARDRDGTIMRLHRFIMDAPEGLFVDHINHDCFDDRRCNLRLVDPMKSMWNQHVRKDNQCGVRGVHQSRGRWIARIKVNKNDISLGQYDTKEEAVTARKAAEIKYFGEYNYDESIAAVPRIEGIPWKEPLEQFMKTNEEKHLIDINQKQRANNTSGCTGVYLHKGRDRARWCAKITVNKKTIYLGTYERFEEAVEARKAAEKKYFGEYAYDYSVSSVPAPQITPADDVSIDVTVAIDVPDPIPEFEVLPPDPVPEFEVLPPDPVPEFEILPDVVPVP